MTVNVSRMPDTMLGRPTQPFTGGDDPLARRIMAIAEREAARASEPVAEVLVMLANSVMPGRGR